MEEYFDQNPISQVSPQYCLQCSSILMHFYTRCVQRTAYHPIVMSLLWKFFSKLLRVADGICLHVRLHIFPGMWCVQVCIFMFLWLSLSVCIDFHDLCHCILLSLFRWESLPQRTKGQKSWQTLLVSYISKHTQNQKRFFFFSIIIIIFLRHVDFAFHDLNVTEDTIAFCESTCFIFTFTL